MSVLLVQIHLVAYCSLIRLWKRQADLSTSSHQRQNASVGDHVPRQSKRDILIGPEGHKVKGYFEQMLLIIILFRTFS